MTTVTTLVGLHKLDGTQTWVNPDLVESVQQLNARQTVVRLASGATFDVRDDVDHIIKAFNDWAAECELNS
jgi:uncharacterized protein YlzI (FlbEa/FlbD family)